MEVAVKALCHPEPLKHKTKTTATTVFCLVGRLGNFHDRLTVFFFFSGGAPFLVGKYESERIS